MFSFVCGFECRRAPTPVAGVKATPNLTDTQFTYVHRYYMLYLYRVYHPVPAIHVHK